MSQCTIIQENNELVLSFPYDAAMVAELKSSIPAMDRKYDPTRKSWRVSPSKAAKIQNLCHKHFGELPLVPNIASTKPVIKSQIINVRYVASTKDRGFDDRSAYGWCNSGWNVNFPEAVLRAWFDGSTAMPDEAPTLYSVLCCQRDATDEQIKSGYRRMAIQWHPDKCHEPNAGDQFRAIQHAYDILSKRRARYDAGLALEMSLRQEKHQENYVSRVYSQDGYRTPLRCGLIMVEGIESLGVFNVSKIFCWEDIRDSSGRTLVVSWPKNAKTFSEEWV